MQQQRQKKIKKYPTSGTAWATDVVLCSKTSQALTTIGSEKTTCKKTTLDNDLLNFWENIENERIELKSVGIEWIPRRRTHRDENERRCERREHKVLVDPLKKIGN